jgi:uncharacterized protein YjbI with pentapeptide repeats
MLNLKLQPLRAMPNIPSQPNTSNARPQTTDTFAGGFAGAFAKLKARFASDRDEERIAALTEALQYADRGREFISHALEHKSFAVKRAAYKLLAPKQKNKRYKVAIEELIELYESGERDFTGSELSGTIYNADLRGADFSYANLNNVDIISTNLNGINLSGASLLASHLSYSNLSNANLSDVNMMGADLSDANLSNANLSNANLAKANFSNADLSNANLSNSATWDWDELLQEWCASMGELIDPSISGMDLRIIAASNVVNLCGADLSGANLIGFDLKGVQINEATKLDPKWQLVWQITNQDLEQRALSHVDLRGACLPFAKLCGVDLRHADLKWANLYRADLQNADLRSTDLSRTELQGANLQGADLRDANLKGAHLRCADLGDANMSNTNLHNADLSDANISNTITEGANLNGANLQDAKFKDGSEAEQTSPNQQKNWQSRFKYWLKR